MTWFLLFEILTMLGLWKGVQHRQKAAQRKTLGIRKPIPMLSKQMARAAGTITDPRKRWGADMLKKAVRAYVASDLFDHAVTGFMNDKSQFHKLAKHLRKSGGLRKDQPISVTGGVPW